MSATAWGQLVALVVALAVWAPLLGRYLAKVYGGGRAPGDRVFGPVERLIYRACGIDAEGEQHWKVYAYSLLAFSFVSLLLLYAQIRLQGHLPLNPDHFKGMPPGLAFNTAVSFLTNTNWQNYAGESTAAQLTQMAGLAFHNFVSAAAGAAVGVALIRGLTRRRTGTLGNFWVDLTRTCTRLLLPIAILGALFFVSQGVVQNFSAARTYTTVQGATQTIPGGPVASQEIIKEAGQNGGGPYNANSAHPFENPNPGTNAVQIFLILLIPFAFPFAYGRMVGDRKQGYVIVATMLVLWLGTSVAVIALESAGNPKLAVVGADQRITATQSGGNMEGKETRFGSASCGLFAGSTTGTSTGAVNCAHDSLTPLGGATALLNIMFGEVDPGGTGSGLYGMLIFALLAVFIAGLMVGRTPEYLGKKIQAAEMKLVVVYILAVPLVILSFSAASVLLKAALGSLGNPGPHGLSEVVYAFTSQANNNGSAFAGINANTTWYIVTGGISMLVGRFFLMIPVLASAGSLARKQPLPPSAGTFPTASMLFFGLLLGVVVLVVGL
ncbi:MAG TPA: potassium-transporting ATPase subunit KdpA, partial [Actinomycetota bacterium]|nr:potassium-transporting ATPase subunit KdpA [Actinomycetota bacterium]